MASWRFCGKGSVGCADIWVVYVIPRSIESRENEVCILNISDPESRI